VTPDQVSVFERITFPLV